MKAQSTWKAPPVPVEEQSSRGEPRLAVTSQAPCCTAEVLSVVSLPQTGMRIACCCTVLWQSKIQPPFPIPYCSSQSSDLAQDKRQSQQVAWWKPNRSAWLKELFWCITDGPHDLSPGIVFPTSQQLEQFKYIDWSSEGVTHLVHVFW